MLVTLLRIPFGNRDYDHFSKDKTLRAYLHLISTAEFLDKSSNDCFSVLNTANTKIIGK